MKESDSIKNYADLLANAARTKSREFFACDASGYAFSYALEAPSHEIVVYCAEPGMGKTTILTTCVAQRALDGDETRYEDFSNSLPDECADRLGDLLRWCTNKSRKARQCVVSCDNIPACDEVDVDRQVDLIRKISRTGCVVLLGIAPEAEGILDRLGEASCFWSCDLCVARDESDDGDEVFDRWTHGIPALVKASGKVQAASPSMIMTNVGYQEEYVDQVISSLRPETIGEERRLRIAMLLLGSGTRADLDDVLDRVDDDIWRLLARDAPLFGVNTARSTFDCVGSATNEGLNVSFRVLCDASAPWPRLVSCCARLLAQRGDFSRAATVSLICSDARERVSVGLEWCSDFVNVGEFNVVSDALSEARKEGFVGLEGMNVARCVLAAVTGDAEASDDHCAVGLDVSSRAGAHARLALMCRDVMRTGIVEQEVNVRDGDTIAEGLLLHVRVWASISSGRLGDAYDLLVNTSLRFGRITVTSALLTMDYVLVSMLCGTPPTSLDLKRHKDVGKFLERAGLSTLLRAHQAVIPVARMLAGRQMIEYPCEVHLQRSSRLGCKFLSGLLLLVLGVTDMRTGGAALARGDVRLRQAIGEFAGLGLNALVKTSHLLRLIIQQQLGERVTKPDLMACKGATQPLDRLVTVLIATMSTTKRDRPVGAGRWGNSGCPRDIYWLVNLFGASCGALSQRFREVVPVSWKDGVARSTNLVDALFEQGPKATNGCGDHDARVAKQERLPIAEEQRDDEISAPVEVTLLGGFEVRVKGKALRSSKLERRRAKSLFTLLAAVPGHAAKRFTVMESVWPDHDYGTAMHYVYAATSVIRTEIAKALGDRDLPLLVANKSEGTLALAECNVCCDVDRFERRAHEVLDAPHDHQKVIRLCKEVEELYKGDLFVPPNDGMGIVEDRARTLRTLYADAMVAGSAAANKEGMRMLACRLGRKAHEADELREDAIGVLVEALCAAGRHVEAERCFEEYVGRVIDMTRRPPSRRLREDVYGLLREASTRTKASAADAQESGGTTGVRIVEPPEDDESGQLRLIFGPEDGDTDA